MFQKEHKCNSEISSSFLPFVPIHIKYCPTFPSHAPNCIKKIILIRKHPSTCVRENIFYSKKILSNKIFYYLNVDIDGSYKLSDTSDMLSEILKNVPYKPMKTVGHDYSSGGYSLNQIPIPNNPPPFKPLKDFPPTYEQSHHVPHAEYGVPYSHEYLSALSSDKKSIVINPKAYDTYHSMIKKNSHSKHKVPLESIGGLEIQKSIEYVIKS
jgi:hypothetical protein